MKREELEKMFGKMPKEEIGNVGDFSEAIKKFAKQKRSQKQNNTLQGWSDIIVKK